MSVARPAGVRLMATDAVKVPSLGDSVTDGTVLKLLKAEGDFVAVDEQILVLETAKLSIDVRSQIAGKITKLHVKERKCLCVCVSVCLCICRVAVPTRWGVLC